LLGDSELEAALQKLGRESTTADETDETDNTTMDFQSTISRVLQELSTNSENLQVIRVSFAPDSYYALPDIVRYNVDISLGYLGIAIECLLVSDEYFVHFVCLVYVGGVKRKR